jgi:beta-lactamase regulating signal transducer with metallopeptidase domain/thiol-disulfide isomerase/thioredoxin
LEAYIPYLPWLWIIGTPVTFTLLAAGIIGTKRLRNAGRIIDEGPIAEMLERLVASLRIGRRVTVAVCDRIAAPVLIGIVRPLILLPPAALAGWTPDEIEMVLLHELAHVRRWDNLINLLQRVVESLLFFHPVVWLVSNWVRREREACCDAAVVARTNRPHAYAEMLVALAAQMPRSVLFHPAASSAMAAGPLRRRVRAILGLQDDPMLISGKSFAIMVAFAVLIASIAVLYVPTIGQAEQQIAENTADIEKANHHGSNVGTDERYPVVLPGAESTQPTFQAEPVDNRWPEGVAFPSPQEGEISKRAYELLGLKIVPAKVEAGVVGAYELEVIGSNQMPPGATGPMLLTEVADENTRNFDELAEALKKVNPNEWTQVGCVATREGQSLQFKFPAGSLDLRRGIQKPIESTSQFREWLASLGDGPRKERFIAERAWKRLGIMVAPLTDADREEFGYPADKPEVLDGLKIVGGNLPEGMPKPAMLVKISSHFASTFDSLLETLDLAEMQGQEKVRCLAHANQKEYLFEAGPPASAQASPPGMYEPSRTAAPKKFPSLDDQKMADLAWKRLGLELEPLHPEELRRVQALGYEGGVRVDQMSSLHKEPQYNEVQLQDILVGLHVWPTTSMKDVAAVLERDDIAELSPLKFYVVRQEAVYSADGSPPELHDEVEITGRISVQTEKQSVRKDGRTTPSPYQLPPTSNAPTSSDLFWAPQPTRSLAPVPQTPPTQPVEPVPSETPSQPHPTATPTPLPGAAPVPNATSEKPGLYYFYSDDSEPSIKMQDVVDDVEKKYAGYFEFKRVDVAKQPNMAKRFRITRVPNLAIVRNGEVNAEIVGLQSLEKVSETLDSHIPLKVPSPSRTRSTTRNRSKLRYEGKSFEEWRDAWQTELSTAKRLEAVKALTAFGANGYGEEAAAAILDIVDQYDWTLIENDATGKLKQAAIDAFTGGFEGFGPQSPTKQHIPSKHWLPILLERMPENKNIQQFSTWVLGYLRPDAAFATDQLLELSRKEPKPDIVPPFDSSVSGGALTALSGIDPNHENEQINKRWKELLDSKDPDDIATALMYSGGTIAKAFKLDLMPWLLDENNSLQQQARFALRYLEPSERDEIRKTLTDIVEDRSRSKVHIAAVRALGALLESTNDDKMHELLDQMIMNRENSVELRAAASQARKRITNFDDGGAGLQQNLKAEYQDILDSAEYREMKQRLTDAIEKERLNP